MPKLGKFTKVWIEGYHLSTRLTGAAPSNVFEEVEQGGFTEDKYYLAGRGDAQIVLEGYFDDTTGTTHDALKTVSASTSSIVSVAFGNNATPTLGDMTAGLDVQQTTYETTPDINGTIGLSAQFKARNEEVDWGVLLADETVTANGNSSSVDNGASTANGGVGYLHITALSAGDTITVLIEDSPNDSAWSTIVTFTLDGTAIDAERIEVAAAADTPERYVRASWTVTGSSISFPIMVHFSRK